MKYHRVFVSGCYDMLHSGHVAFFKEASRYGDLYVGIGSDETIFNLKGRRPICSEMERLFMVKAVRYVTDARINEGSGMMDFVESIEYFHPDTFVVNEDGSSAEKEQFCKEHGIDYIVLKRIPEDGLTPRSTTSLRAYTPCQIPTRLDLAGTWIDQPYVSCYAPGWAITISIEPTFEIKERCGLSTSTRNAIKKIWPYQLPDMDPETLAKLSFCFENQPEGKGPISGAQDAIGICMPGLVRHYYDGAYWPNKIESCCDEHILAWLETHLCMFLMFPRRDGCSVVEGKNITQKGVERLATAAEDCWNSIEKKDLNDFADAYHRSFDAQIAMFPAMIQEGVQDFIDRYKAMDDVLAWKMPGAGGGGYLVMVVRDSSAFCKEHPECFTIKIRRRDS